MRRAAIVTPLRTPVGRFGGALKDVPVERLGATVVNALLDRTGLDPALVDDVVFAQSYANSETPCVGRWIALEARLAQAYQAGIGIERLYHARFKYWRGDVEVEELAFPGSFPSGRHAGRYNPEAAFAVDGVVAAST